MPEMFVDLHIHSCLSPCGDADMTPGNILGMAALKGLDAVAIADHNSALNLPAAQEIAGAYGVLLVPAMEITTREEVHLLGYFPDVRSAVACGEMLRAHLPKRKNKPALFGEQLILDADDRVIGAEEALLIGATDLPLAEAAAQVTAFGGVPVPAHINRGANGLLINLGLMPPEPFYSTVEVWRLLPCDEGALRGRHVLHSSDAHYLGDIQEREHALRLREGTTSALLAWMRSVKDI